MISAYSSLTSQTYDHRYCRLLFPLLLLLRGVRRLHECGEDELHRDEEANRQREEDIAVDGRGVGAPAAKEHHVALG